MRKHILLFLAVFWVLGIFSGCRIVKIEEEAAQPVRYTIVLSDDIPEELQELIEERKKEEFELTYQRGEDLYLVKGYGQQMTGGYSIQVKGLTASASAFFFKTCFFGPREQPQHSTPSYPYIVVKTTYQDLPVQYETVLCDSEKIN